ncbi:MAG TPA: hypothetical protein VJU34_08505, partial [Phenylobacterium sp.]|nr:hypothetical protein [Phenylobacterium sp.]
GLELVIVALIYAASLLLSQRIIALAAPQMQELGFVVAGIVAVSTAAIRPRSSSARPWAWIT